MGLHLRIAFVARKDAENDLWLRRRKGGAEGTEGFCDGATQITVAAGKPGEKKERTNPPLLQDKNEWGRRGMKKDVSKRSTCRAGVARTLQEEDR